MTGKTKTSNEKTYDYFKTDPIVLNGRFARYADAMWVQNKIEDKSKFSKLLDLYAVAVIIGFRKTDVSQTIRCPQIREPFSWIK